MRYTVTWTADAENRLAEIWLSTPNQRRVADAVNRVERLLRTHAEVCGQEFYGDRLLFIDPVAIVFAVEPDDRLVKVLDVRHR